MARRRLKTRGTRPGPLSKQGTRPGAAFKSGRDIPSATDRPTNAQRAASSEQRPKTNGQKRTVARVPIGWKPQRS